MGAHETVFLLRSLQPLAPALYRVSTACGHCTTVSVCWISFRRPRDPAWELLVHFPSHTGLTRGSGTQLLCEECVVKGSESGHWFSRPQSTTCSRKPCLSWGRTKRLQVELDPCSPRQQHGQPSAEVRGTQVSSPAHLPGRPRRSCLCWSSTCVLSRHLPFNVLLTIAPLSLCERRGRGQSPMVSEEPSC